MTAKLGRRDFYWEGDTLYRGKSAQAAVEIIRDEICPTMWRVRGPDGSLSDLTNKTRCKDAALAIHLADHRAQLSPVEAPLVSVTPTTGITLASSL